MNYLRVKLNVSDNPYALLSLISEQPPNWAEALAAISSAVTLVAVIIAYVQILNLNRQMHREFEMQYLQRFWKLMDQRSEKFKLTGRPKKSDRTIIREYLVLCEDQVALRALGRVTDHTWNFWRVDIHKLCTSESIYPTYRSTVSDYPHLQRLIGNPMYDPLDKNWIQRKLRGL